MPDLHDGRLSFRPVDSSTWPDFERLFEARGGPKYCWCLAWRGTSEEARSLDGPGRKKAMRQRVQEGVPVGILACREGRPAAWCSIAPRSTYRPLGGPEEAPGEKVWSLVLEACPVDPDSPSCRFMGFVESFREAGYREVGRAGSRRRVMRKALA